MAMFGVVAKVLQNEDHLSTLDMHQISEENQIKGDELYEVHKNMQLVSIPIKSHTSDDDSFIGDENGMHIRSVSSILSERNGKYYFFTCKSLRNLS